MAAGRKERRTGTGARRQAHTGARSQGSPGCEGVRASAHNNFAAADLDGAVCHVCLPRVRGLGGALPAAEPSCEARQCVELAKQALLNTEAAAA